MDIIFKTSEFFYLHRGLLKNKWKEGVFVLFSDSRLQWYEKASDKKPIVNINETFSFLFSLFFLILFDSSCILNNSDQNTKGYHFIAWNTWVPVHWWIHTLHAQSAKSTSRRSWTTVRLKITANINSWIIMTNWKIKTYNTF